MISARHLCVIWQAIDPTQLGSEAARSSRQGQLLELRKVSLMLLRSRLLVGYVRCGGAVEVQCDEEIDTERREASIA